MDHTNTDDRGFQDLTGRDPDLAPRSPDDPRPGNSPYYVEPNCTACGTPLVLWDEIFPDDEEGTLVFYDEWGCPNCKTGVILDWPAEEWQEIIDAMNDPATIELKADDD